MAETTGISWCDATINFWWGCTKVSAACDACYAETWSKRTGKDIWGHGKPRLKIKSAAATAFKLQRRAEREGRRLQVFSNSMSDIGDAEMADEWRDEAFAVMALTPQLDWLLLTKRPHVLAKYLGDRRSIDRIGVVVNERFGRPFDEIEAARWRLHGWPLPNVALGVTTENQEMAELRIPELLSIPAAAYWVSGEPLLGAVDLTTICTRSSTINALTGSWQDREDPSYCGFLPGRPRLHFVVTGGETGAKARPSHPDWFRSLRDQCAAAGVAYHHKQNGEWAPEAKAMRDCWPPRQWHEWPDAAAIRVGKKRAGRLLDGVEHNDRARVG